MTLNGTQSKVLLEIGTSPGGNAFSIAKKLNRDPGGINKVCAALHQKGLISVTEGKNIKNAPVNELKLTLLGFALVADMLFTSHTGGDDDPFPSDHGTKIASLLNCNQDLHEGIGIFSEYFSFVIKRYDETPPPGEFGSVGRRATRAGYSNHTFKPMVSAVKRFVEAYTFMVKHRPPGLGPAELEPTVRLALYRDLFFEMWDRVQLYEAFSLEGGSDSECEYIKNIVIPEFKISSGWEDILGEIRVREYKCKELKTLKALL